MGVTVRKWRWAFLPLALAAIPPLASAQDRPPIDSPPWLGTGSCAAAACHGGRREPLGLKGSEYSFSATYDPHNRAYSVLFDERSKQIEKNLKGLADLDSARPFENDACLRCHVHQGYDSKDIGARSVGFAVADGVSCEGCHGPAGGWIVPHAEAGWNSYTDRQKFELFGMRSTQDLLARGQACSECHVGLGEMDVNHDLIAAGHPRLNFEYGSQLAKLPKHWRVDDDKARHPDYEAKVWALGQVLTAQASLDLLAARAKKAVPEEATAPWPEFAEYSCFSCHHELGKDKWSPANVTKSSNPGTLQWGTWSMPMAASLPSGISGLDADDPISPLGVLRFVMTGPDPDPAVVAQRAHASSVELARVADSLNRGQIAPSEIRSMLTKTLKADLDTRPLDWDRSARQYLAIVALDKALAEPNPRAASHPGRAGLEKLLRDLNLPLRVGGRNEVFDSPYRFDAERIKGDLRSVRAGLLNP